MAGGVILGSHDTPDAIPLQNRASTNALCRGLVALLFLLTDFPGKQIQHVTRQRHYLGQAWPVDSG